MSEAAAGHGHAHAGDDQLHDADTTAHTNTSHDDATPHGAVHAHPHGHSDGTLHSHEHTHGAPHTHWHMPDMNVREWAAILPLLVIMLWMGVKAQTFLPSISASNAKALSLTQGSMEQRVKSAQPKVVADGR
jgi:hypothetical protein